MKNFYQTLLFILLMGTTQLLSAQTNFGVRAGLNLASINIDFEGLTASPSSRIGVTLAGIAEIGVSENMAIQPELHFIQKGYKSDSGGDETKLSLNYLELPIHVKYLFGGEGQIGGYVLGGPAVGFALGGKSKTCFNGNCDSENVEFSDDDGFRRLEVGLSFGGGITINQNLFVDLRYVLGITNLAEEDFQEIKYRNKGIQLGVGYMFGGE